jgi:hypothetical protein
VLIASSVHTEDIELSKNGTYYYSICHVKFKLKSLAIEIKQ